MNYRKHILFLLLLFVSASLFAQRETPLSKAVTAVHNDPTLKHASLSVCVYNAKTNTSVYSYDAHRSMTPASLAKIFTTSVAFDKLGDKFRFKTTLSYSGTIDDKGVLHGNIYIIGGGDPMLGSFRYRQTCPDSIFAAWFRAIQSYGIKSIDGRVCYDATIFDNKPLHDTWQWGDVGNYYACGVSGLNFHENLYFLYFNAGAKLGYPAELVSVSPENIEVKNKNEVFTGASNSGDQVIVYGDPNSQNRLCRGTVPFGQKNFRVRAALPNSGETCARLFSIYLRNHKVNVYSSVSEVLSRPEGLNTIMEYHSNNLYELAQYTNFTSNNMYAESIYKYLGFKVFGTGSYENGAKVIETFFKNHNLESSGVRIVDGSGLSRSNRITTDFLCRYLTEVYHMPIYSDFVMTLGKVGESGTVKNMLPNLPQNVTMRMKSGTMDGVRGFAGYLTTHSGEVYSFAVLCNEYDCSGNQMKEKLETILYEISMLD